jgi:thiamine transporter ThiT
VSLRIRLTIAALTGIAVVLVLVPTYRVADWVMYALVVADFVAIGLIARDARALWASVAFAAALSVAWYISFFSTEADDGLFDGLIIGVIALISAGVAVAAGVLAGRVSPRRKVHRGRSDLRGRSVAGGGQ